MKDRQWRPYINIRWKTTWIQVDIFRLKIYISSHTNIDVNITTHISPDPVHGDCSQAYTHLSWSCTRHLQPGTHTSLLILYTVSAARLRGQGRDGETTDTRSPLELVEHLPQRCTFLSGAHSSTAHPRQWRTLLSGAHSSAARIPQLRTLLSGAPSSAAHSPQWRTFLSGEPSSVAHIP